MSQPTRDRTVEALFAPLDVRAYSHQASEHLIAHLYDDERSQMAPMSDGRRAEFATARACAHAALADLGVRTSVPRSDGGAPLWPDGLTGSISHSRGFCLAVASGGDHTIGVDAEVVARIKPSVERRILVDAERDVLEGLDDDDRRLRVATIFAAKEAFYKAHYGADPRYLGFDAVTVHLEQLGAGTKVTFAPASGAVDAAMLTRTSGNAMLVQGRVIVGAWIGATAR